MSDLTERSGEATGAAHTPGPWEYGEGTRNFNIRALLGSVATVKKNLYTENARTEADACLIAAAPDLLAALRSLLQYADGLHHLQARIDGERVDYETFPKARAAIAKALSGRAEPSAQTSEPDAQETPIECIKNIKDAP